MQDITSFLYFYSALLIVGGSFVFCGIAKLESQSKEEESLALILFVTGLPTTVLSVITFIIVGLSYLFRFRSF